MLHKIAKSMVFGAFVFAGFSNSAFAACSGYACDGLDPIAAGCSTGAVTVASKISDTPYNKVLVELRWSPTCKTNWSKISYYNVFSTLDPNIDNLLVPDLLSATIYRVTGKPIKYVGAVNPKSGTYWSPMVYANGMQAYAEGNAYVKGLGTNMNIIKKYVVLSTTIR